MSQQPPGDPAARRQPPRQGAAGNGGRSGSAADPATRQRQAAANRPAGSTGGEPGGRSGAAAPTPPGRAIGPVYGAGQPRPADASAAPNGQAGAEPSGGRPSRRPEPLPDHGLPRDPFAGESGPGVRSHDPYAPPAGDPGTARRAAGRDPYADPYSRPDPFAAADADAFDPSPRASRPARSARPAPSSDPDDPTDPSAWGDEFGDPLDDAGWDALADDEAPVAPRARSGRRPAARRTPRPAVALPAFRMPAALVSGDLVGDRVAFALFAASLAGALVMAIVLLTQIGRLPDVMVVHLDAAGIPDRWGVPRVLWRLPLIAFGVSLMNAVVAWFVAPLDRFAARFVLAAALVVQLITWAALFSLL